MKKKISMSLFGIAALVLTFSFLLGQNTRALVPGTNTLVSVNSAGTGPGNDHSPFQAGGSGVYTQISANGKFVVFSSTANNLVSGDTNGKEDVFLRDLANNTTSRINVSTSGVQADNGFPVANVSNVAVSSTGRYVVYASRASNLIDSKSISGSQIYMRDTKTNTTSHVTSTSSGTYDNTATYQVVKGVSNDGRFVLWAMGARNVTLDPTGLATTGYHIYLSDTKNKTVKLMNTTSGYTGSLSTGDMAMSCDGSTVAFTSSLAFDVADTNTFGDIFISDVRNGYSVKRISNVVASPFPVLNLQGLSMSCNGEFLTFSSPDNSFSTALPPSNTIQHKYLYDLINDQFTLISTSSSGVLGNADSSLLAGVDNKGNVAFVSAATNLIDGFTRPFYIAYLKHKETGLIESLSLNTSGTPTSIGTGITVSLTEDGKKAAYFVKSSVSSMFTGDTNARDDVIYSLTGL